MDKVYLLIEDDDTCDMSIRVFSSIAGVEAAFAETLHEHFNDNGYSSAHEDDTQRTFQECVDYGNFVEDGYWLTIQKKTLE